MFFLADRYTAEGPGWRWFRRAAGRIGLEVVGRARWHERRRSYREIADRVRASGARAVYIDAYVAANTGQMLRDLRAVLDPDVQIIGNMGFTPVGQLFENTGPAARGVLINSFFEVGLTALGFVRRVGIAAFLTTTEYGFWGLIVTTLLTLSWLKQVGISDKYVQQDDPDEQLADLDVQSTGDALKHPRGGILLATFYLGEV